MFHGRTTGEFIYADVQSVLEKFKDETNVVLDTIGITDTTGNMGKLGVYCRANGPRHAYCIDHNFNRNAQLAFDRESLLSKFIIYNIMNVIYHESYQLITQTAKNIPRAASAMKKARATCGYFESSTQAMGKLLDFQRTSTIEEYQNQERPKKTLQDVITRWWSTFRSLRRLRWLKKAIAIKGLIGSEQIILDDLTADEWLVLHQIEIVLETMAYWQRILEGNKYVTGSLSAVAVYQIRATYVDVIESELAEEPIRDLTRILLKDFDERYHPAEGGKVKYFPEDTLGRGQRYVGLHQYFFFAAFLDPRVMPLLKEDDIMTGEDYKELKGDIIDQMVAKSKAMKKKSSDDQGNIPTAPSQTTKSTSKKPSKASQMLRGLNTKPRASSTVDNDDELRDDCRAQLNRFIKDAVNGACPLESDDTDHGFNDPLKWWKDNAFKYDLLSHLARLCLAIPATSAPSERIWSRAARILTLKRARLKEDAVVARMMFVRENIRFLRKHYVELAKAERDANLHDLIEYEMEYLPPLHGNEKEDGIDVGQDDHLVEF